MRNDFYECCNASILTHNDTLTLLCGLLGWLSLVYCSKYENHVNRRSDLRREVHKSLLSCKWPVPSVHTLPHLSFNEKKSNNQQKQVALALLLAYNFHKRLTSSAP